MGAKPFDAGADAGGAERRLVEATDDLYAGPFEGFVARRKELVARLRAAGDTSGAQQLAAASKPTRTAWALNQVARAQPGLIAAVVESREAATLAQKNGDASTIREGARRHREAVAGAIRAARSLLTADGVSLSATQARRMGETLQALATDDAERERLTAGRLTHDVAVDDPFAGLEIGPPTRHAKAGPRAHEETSAKRAGDDADADAARKREAERIRREKELAVGEARARVTAAEHAVSEGRSAAADAKRALALAQNQADRAREALDELSQDLARARDHLKRLLAGGT